MDPRMDRRTDRRTTEYYAQVQQFYARQMRLAEEGLVDSWAGTFAEDAVFEDSSAPVPLRGRTAIRDAVRTGVEQIAAAGLDFRHWFGLIEVLPQPDGSLRTRYYALAMATPRGGTLRIHGNAECRDHLVPEDGGGWLVRQRAVSPDGLGLAQR